MSFQVELPERAVTNIRIYMIYKLMPFILAFTQFVTYKNTMWSKLNKIDINTLIEKPKWFDLPYKSLIK